MKIAIIGAGLMGRLLGLRLLQDGYTDLDIFEKDSIQESSSPAFIAAGMISPNCEIVSGGKLIYDLGKNSLSLWHKHLSNLNALHLLNDTGTILISDSNFQREATHYLEKSQFLLQARQSSDYVPLDYFKFLNKEALRNLEPSLDFFQGYLLENEGVINSYATMQFLGKYLQNNITWHHSTNVLKIDAAGLLTFSTKNIPEKTCRFDLIFDCRGLGAKNTLKDLRGIRGEVIRVNAPEVNITRSIRFFHPRHNIYIAPYGNNNYVVGATEIENEDYSPISVRSTLELLSSLYAVNRKFAEARIIAMDTSCRPTFNDSLPQIEISQKTISINGLYRHGFLIAPELAEEVIRYLNNKQFIFPEIWKIST